jgi:polyferredoxin
MGIDIRDGVQLECIQCALCIDACNEIMDRVERPRNLIAYDTFRNLDAASHHDRAPLRLIRPRTILYATVMAIVAGIMLWAWLNRTMLEINVLHDRNPLFVQLTDGGLRNGYTVKILNKLHEKRTFELSTSGLEGVKLAIVGLDGSDPKIDVATDNLRALKVHITVPKDERDDLEGAATPFQFVVTDLSDGSRPTTGNVRGHDRGSSFPPAALW